MDSSLLDALKVWGVLSSRQQQTAIHAYSIVDKQLRGADSGTFTDCVFTTAEEIVHLLGAVERATMVHLGGETTQRLSLWTASRKID